MARYLAYKRFNVCGTNEEVADQLRHLQYDKKDADLQEFMLGFSNRATVIGEKISNNSIDEFIRDLLYYGYLEEVEDLKD